MKIYYNLTDLQECPKPATLTIGNFDGVHLGHQAVIHRVLHLSKLNNAQSTVITFENHPAEILHPGREVPRLCTLKHKLKLLEEAGVQNVVLLKFTKSLAEETAEAFLKEMHQYLHFQGLVLGHDATLGKDRQGNPQRIREFATGHHFHVEYLPPYMAHGIQVSSTKIRTLIQTGDFPLAESLLGRKFSIYSNVRTGAGRGKGLGFPTANIEIAGLCLPPLGVYAVNVNIRTESLPGVANLGLAPTVRQDNKPVLEVHLLEQQQDLYGEDIEVVFYGYIRPEQKFANLDLLKHQIKRDIESAKALLGEQRAL